MATRLRTLYENDFYAWTRDQARALHRLKLLRPNVDLDLDRLAQEIRDMGREQWFSVQSHIERLIEHLLKLEFSPSASPRRQWLVTVNDARNQLDRRLTPSLRRRLPKVMPRLYANARRNAVLALEDHGEMDAATALPATNPYPLHRLLDLDWLPARARERANDRAN